MLRLGWFEPRVVVVRADGGEAGARRLSEAARVAAAPCVPRCSNVRVTEPEAGTAVVDAALLRSERCGIEDDDVCVALGVTPLYDSERMVARPCRFDSFAESGDARVEEVRTPSVVVDVACAL